MTKVLVTGIGGGVGQGILRNIRDIKEEIHIIGTNVNQVSAGNYLCDNVYVVPYAYAEDYVYKMLEICIGESIDLIIPSTDYETYYLSHSAHKFQCEIASSPSDISAFCLDKYKTFQALKKYNIPFAKSFLPSDYTGQFSEIIVKPREGRGSRDIHFNPDDLSSFDDSYVVQELLKGKEITTAFYVKKSGALHGLISFQRELEAGNTSRAEVIFECDDELEKIIKNLILIYPFRGSCNIQSISTPLGIVPFEINCRISGTNSIRSQFGFKDVKYTIQEYLFDEEPEPTNITKGSAIRTMLDIIYPGIPINEVKDNGDQFYIF